MRFDRAILKDWLESLLASSTAKDRCIDHNFRIEENVSDERRLELESLDPEYSDAEDIFKSYYLIYVQGDVRGHVPSTFEMSKNFPALQTVAVQPARKLMRLECLDEHLLPEHDGIDFDELNLAVNGGKPDAKFELMERFHGFPGERPVFSGCRSEIRHLLRKKDWLPRIIDFFGLYHHYPYDSGKPNCFGLFEYNASEVIEQTGRKGI